MPGRWVIAGANPPTLQTRSDGWKAAPADFWGAEVVITPGADVRAGEEQTKTPPAKMADGIFVELNRRFRSPGNHHSQYMSSPPPADALAFSGLSAINASLVNNNVATDAALASAVRVTLVGSMTPDLTKSSYSSVNAL